MYKSYQVLLFFLILICICLSCAPEHHRSGEYEYGEYPFPFSPITTAELEIADSAKVRMEVYNINGEMVLVPLDSILGPQRYSVDLADDSLESGIYFYKVIYVGIPSGDTTVVTKKMLLFR